MFFCLFVKRSLWSIIWRVSSLISHCFFVQILKWQSVSDPLNKVRYRAARAAKKRCYYKSGPQQDGGLRSEWDKKCDVLNWRTWASDCPFRCLDCAHFYPDCVYFCLIVCTFVWPAFPKFVCGRRVVGQKRGVGAKQLLPPDKTAKQTLNQPPQTWL